MENFIDSYLKEQKLFKSSLKRRIRTLKKNIVKYEDHLIACKNWQNFYHEAELIQAHFYLIKRDSKEIIVNDWEKEGKVVSIVLDKKLSPAADIAKRFKIAGKLKKGLPYAEKEIARTLETLKLYSEMEGALEKITTLEELETLKKNHSFPKPQEKKKAGEKSVLKPYREYKSETGILIWVGKTAALNDKLTFSCAHGNDLWLHVSGYPGSHVVIRGENVDDTTLNQALQLALYYSKAKRFEEGEVVLTKVKHVKRCGREKGKVQIANEKRYFVRLT